MRRAVSFLARKVLCSLLAELHLEHVLDHLIEDRVAVVRLWHFAELVGHIEQEFSQCGDHLFTLHVLSEVLLPILDHVLDLLHHQVLHVTTAAASIGITNCGAVCPNCPRASAASVTLRNTRSHVTNRIALKQLLLLVRLLLDSALSLALNRLLLVPEHAAVLRRPTQLTNIVGVGRS